MLSSIYLFFGAVGLVLLFLALYDWGATKARVAGFPALLSAVVNLMNFGFSFRVTAFDSGVAISALQGYESMALGCFWFLLAVIGMILSLVIYLESPKEIGVV